VPRSAIYGHLWFVDVVYDVIEARSAAIGGRSSDLHFLLLDFAAHAAQNNSRLSWANA
jgi:hypothetical protein